MVLSLLFLVVSAIPVHMASPRMYQSYDYSEEQTITEAVFVNETTTSPATSTPGCLSCDADKVREWKIEMIKSSILQKLGMTHPPNITGRPLPENPPILEHLSHFPNAPMDEDEMIADEPTRYSRDADPESSASVRRILIMATDPPVNVSSPNVVCFDADVHGQDIALAHLWVYVDKVDVVQRTVTRLSVYIIIPATPTSPLKKKLYKKKTISLSTTQGQWQRFDAKQLTNEWMKDTSTTYRYIQLEVQDNTEYDVVITDANDRLRPLLDIEFRYRKPHVPRRLIHQACPEVGRKPCCRHPIIIDFAEIGWNWVLAPRSFKSHYCNGDCSVSFSRFNRHTQLLILNNSPMPCCSARKHSDFKILYFTENAEVVFAVLPGVIVEECSCV